MGATEGIPRSARAEWAGRAGLVLLGLVLAFALAEAALQIAGVAVRATTGRPLTAAWTKDHVRILCLGDSNTFGLHLERDEAYPDQLQELWNETVGSPRVEVLNLGYPGMDTTRLIRDFDRIWDALAPDVVLLMIGVNDFWADPVPLDGGPGLPFWKRHARLYRLYLLMRRVPAPEIQPLRGAGSPFGPGDRLRVGTTELEVGFTASGGKRDPQVVLGHLLELAGRIRSRGIVLHLMTYPARSRLYAAANPLIREAAERSGTSLIDLAAVFEPLCPGAGCPELLYEDNHPTKAGYRVVAEAIRSHLAPDPRRSRP